MSDREAAEKAAYESPFSNGNNLPTYHRAYDAFEAGFLDGITYERNRVKPSISDEEACKRFMEDHYKKFDLNPSSKNGGLLQYGYESACAHKNAQVAELVEALRFYAECRHYKVETVRGRIIEYDVDAGPLYEHYQEVLPTEERGEKARLALEKFEGSR